MTDRLGNYYTGHYVVYGPDVGQFVGTTDDPEVVERYEKDPRYRVYNEKRF